MTRFTKDEYTAISEIVDAHVADGHAVIGGVMPDEIEANAHRFLTIRSAQRKLAELAKAKPAAKRTRTRSATPAQ